MGLQVHLVDGTYELFRHFFAVPSHTTADGREVGALRGVVGSLLGMLEEGATHIGVATDHVIESFRNEMWLTYKTGAGVDPALRSQFEPLEHALPLFGITVWPMVEYEADDALATAASMAAADDRVDQVLICTPDKDLAQCVGGKVVQLDRRAGKLMDTDGVVAKFGVPPASIPDYLALVGDTADGFPGLEGWGAKSAAALLARYGRLEAIPADPGNWDVKVRGAPKLAATLVAGLADAMLFRRLATLETDAVISAGVDEMEWRGPRPEVIDLAGAWDATGLAERAVRLAERRGLGRG